MYKRIYDSEEIVVDYYNDGKPMVRVSQFKDGHFLDEHFVEIPVETARWEWERMGVEWGIVCSSCGTGWWMSDADNMVQLAQAHKYCPKCGKPMVFEEEGDWVAQEVTN